MKTVGTYYYVHEAEIARCKLESEGINAFVKDEFTGQLGGYTPAIGWIRLQVMENDFERALSVVSAENRVSDEYEPDVLDGVTCPRCRSSKISLAHHNWLFYKFVQFFFCNRMSKYGSKYRCLHCHYEWKPGEREEK